MGEIGEFINSVGYPTALLVGIFLAGRYLLHRLLDEDKGILTKWQASDEKTKARLDAFCTRTESFCTAHTAQTEGCVNDLSALRAAALEGCHFCRTLAAEYPGQQEALCRHVDEMERIIKSEH